MARKAKPWAVVVYPPGSCDRTEYTSQAKAYERVRAELDNATTTRIRVHQWEHSPGRWILYDEIEPRETP